MALGKSGRKRIKAMYGETKDHCGFVYGGKADGALKWKYLNPSTEADH